MDSFASFIESKWHQDVMDTEDNNKISKSSDKPANLDKKILDLTCMEEAHATTSVWVLTMMRMRNVHISDSNGSVADTAGGV